MCTVAYASPFRHITNKNQVLMVQENITCQSNIVSNTVKSVALNILDVINTNQNKCYKTLCEHFYSICNEYDGINLLYCVNMSIIILFHKTTIRLPATQLLATHLHGFITFNGFVLEVFMPVVICHICCWYCDCLSCLLQIVKVSLSMKFVLHFLFSNFSVI